MARIAGAQGDKGRAHSAVTVKGVQDINRKIICTEPATERQIIISGHCLAKALGSGALPGC